jgi:hypothetical protein
LATQPPASAPAQARPQPLFAAPGTPAEVAAAYLRSRITEGTVPTLAAAVDQHGDDAAIGWSTAGAPADPASPANRASPAARGTLRLHRFNDVWAVVLATTDGVDLTGIVNDGRRVGGTIKSSTFHNAFWSSVFTASGAMLAEAGPSELFTLEVRATPVLFRVRVESGTTRTISEVRLDPPPLPRHHDMANCVQRNGPTGNSRQPEPDVVWQACAASLDGAVIGSGPAGAATWELVAADEPTGRWVTLRAPDLSGLFHISDGPTPAPPAGTVVQLGPCCTLDGFTLVAGEFGPGTEAVRITLKGGESFKAQTVTDLKTGSRYAVVPIPMAKKGPATVEVQLADGKWHPTGMPLDLAVIGG